jgi:hypothetical protein
MKKKTPEQELEDLLNLKFEDYLALIGGILKRHKAKRKSNDNEATSNPKP